MLIPKHAALSVTGGLSWCEGGVLVRSHPGLDGVVDGSCSVVAELTGVLPCATVFGGPGVM